SCSSWGFSLWFDVARPRGRRVSSCRVGCSFDGAGLVAARQELADDGQLEQLLLQQVHRCEHHQHFGCELELVGHDVGLFRVACLATLWAARPVEDGRTVETATPLCEAFETPLPVGLASVGVAAIGAAWPARRRRCGTTGGVGEVTPLIFT